MTSPPEEEFLLLGLSIYAAQRVEFVLYGLAAHASHTPQAQLEKRFRNLTAETFLRGDVSELKATLGQLCVAFGDVFLINIGDLVQFYQDRNLVSHNFFRTFHTQIRGQNAPQDNPCEFLRNFIARASYWEKVLRGLLFELMTAAATRQGREMELAFTDLQIEDMRIYRDHVHHYLNEKTSRHST